VRRHHEFGETSVGDDISESRRGVRGSRYVHGVHPRDGLFGTVSALEIVLETSGEILVKYGEQK
jgi:hypothetical protein